MDFINIVPYHPTIYNFQKCILSRALVTELEENHGKFFEAFISIGISTRCSRLVLRCCKSSIGDVAHAIQCDFRVAELLLPSVSQFYANKDLEPGDKDSLELRKELELGRHLLSKSSEEKMNVLNSSGFDVDEDVVESSVKFNDALYCTSKDIQMLKSGTIKMMRLTVISDSSLSDFLYETNHKMTEGGMSRDEKKSKEEETTADELEMFSRISPTWKLLREKIRQVFQSYEIHVKPNALVDLRHCPLATNSKSGCPSTSFVFVEECVFRDTESDVGKVASKTEILISHVRHISHYKRQEVSGVEHELFGVENVGKLLTSLIEMQKTKEKERGKCLDNLNSHGLLIAGPSGCGKNKVVRETVKKLRANLLVFNTVGKADLIGRFGDAWTEIFMNAVQTALVYPTVLLIPKLDECLLIKQNKSRHLATKLLNHVCNLLDAIPKNANLTVVATTDKPFLIPTKLRRAGRLEREVYIGAPTEEERLNILKSLSKKVPSLSKLELDSVARRTPGYVGQDLIRVAHLAILKSYEENCIQVADSHIKYALSRILPSVLQGALGVVVGIHRATSLDHIAGLASVKHDLIKAIVWPLKYPHAFRTMGITPPKGILLHSPPGCAKTTLVRAIAASHKTNFLSVSAAELFSSGVGDSEKIVADLFHRARMASPCILFIDELEAIVGSRQVSQKKERTTNESILSMLLTEMDGIGTQSPCVTDPTFKNNPDSLGPLVLVVAATNRIDMIDSALIRPGRFDKLIYVPPLDKSGRLELLHICAKTSPFSPNVDFEEIAETTDGWTGADIVNLCREAALIALSKDMSAVCITTEDVLEAKAMSSPSLALAKQGSPTERN